MADPFSGFNTPMNKPPQMGGFGPNPSKQNKNQIITNLYRTILGREPDPNALMYYISLPEINEDQIRKQMVESEEHKNILAEFKNITNLKKEIEDLKTQVQIKEQAANDKNSEIDQLNTILAHKSQEITKAKDALEEYKKSNGTQKRDSLSKEVAKVDTGIKRIIKNILRKLHYID